MPKINTPDRPKRGGCDPYIKEEPLEIPDEAPIEVPVEMPIEEPAALPL